MPGKVPDLGGLKVANKLSTLLFVIFLACPVAASAEEEWGFDYISREKMNIALDLTGPVYRCLVREDTDHPVFKGCIDWHSSVHATWALIAYTNASGDNRYIATIKKTLNKTGLDKEREHLRKAFKFEMPYGRAWFLRLCLEYEKLFQDELLAEFGDEVADSLVAFYKANPPNPLTKSYKNPTWALINLLDYGYSHNRQDLIAFVSDQVDKYYFKESASCQFEDSRPNFMAVCTNWAWLVGSVVNKEQFIPWVNNFIPPGKLTQPLKQPQKSHEYGLNFSRSWGLMVLYQLTGQKAYLEAFTNSFLESYLERSHWDGDYKKVGHWVAQFGMFALLAPSQFRLNN